MYRLYRRYTTPPYAYTLYCKTTNFHERLILVNCNFSWFVNTNFRKLGLSTDQNMKNPSVKTNFRTFVQFTKFMKISPEAYENCTVYSISFLTRTF